MSGLRERRGLGGTLGLVGAGVLMVLCCAGPLLLGLGRSVPSAEPCVTRG